MARTGNFGRQPRSSPSITNTLIAIAREQQAREDDNIMDAWQKGGMVDGREVTDEMVLDHWRKRLVDISEDDPLYDTYKNSVLQLEYSVAQSKMTAKYALIAEPSSGDDMAMYNFFIKWSKKVPKNSEFYRVLQRDAGQYLRAAKAKRTVRARVDTEKIFREQMAGLERKNERAGQTALRVLTMLAQQGAVIDESPLGDPRDIANRSNIMQAQLGGIEAIMNLLGTVMTETTVVNPETGFTTGTRATGPNQNVLYTDENGQPVTGESLVAQFRALDPSFNGKFDLTYVQGAISSARDGIEKRIKLAERTGHIAEASSLRLEQAKMNEFARQVDAYPVAAEYNDLREQMQGVITDNTLLPDAKVARITALRAEMGKLADDPRIEADTRMQTQLRAEALGQEGIATLGEDLHGQSVGYSDNVKDNQVVNDHLELFAEQKAAVDAMEMVYTQGVYEPDAITGKMKFVPQTGGPSVGAATMADINNLPGVGQAVPVMVPNGDGGGATPMYVVPAPIRVTGNAVDGTEMAGTNANPAGSFIKYMVNGQPVTLYSITREGKTEWTNDPPWDASAVDVSQGANGVMNVTLNNSSFDQSNIDLTVNGPVAGRPGYYVSGAVETMNGTTPGRVVFNPQEVLPMTDPGRVHAGPDSFTDSFSASLAAVKTAPEGDKLLSQWTGDRRFNEILDHNAHMAAGQTFNEASGMWTGGDPAAYQRNLTGMQNAISDAKGGGLYINPPDRDDWRRDSIDLAPDAAKPAVNRPTGPQPSRAYEGGVQGIIGLPSTVIQKQPEARFKALGFGYIPGTNQLANPGKVADDRLTLTTGLNLKVPAVQKPYIPTAAAAPAPSASPKPASTTPYSPPTYTSPTTTPYKPPKTTGPSGYTEHL